MQWNLDKKSKLKIEMSALFNDFNTNSINFIFDDKDYDLEKTVTNTLNDVRAGRRPKLDWKDKTVSFSFEVRCPQDYEAFADVDELLEGTVLNADNNYDLTGQIWSEMRPVAESIFSIRSRYFTHLTPNQISKLVEVQSLLEDYLQEVFMDC